MKYSISFLILFLLFSCSNEPKSQLDQLMEREAKVSDEENELLMNLWLGMPKSKFYQFCAEKNKTGEFMDGGRMHQVHTKVKEGFSTPVDFYFYSEFNDNGLYKQENKFKFIGWAPWNEHLDANHLFPEVIHFLSQQFGDDFIEVQEKDKLLHSIDIDANRRIDVYTKPLDDAYVYMDVVDLRRK